MQETFMPTARSCICCTFLLKMRIITLRFKIQSTLLKMSWWDRWRCGWMQSCMLTSSPSGFTEVTSTLENFALLAEDQTWAFKYCLSPWLMVSQLSNHIKLCNLIFHLGAFDNRNLCGVSRKRDLLRVSICVPENLERNAVWTLWSLWLRQN